MYSVNVALLKRISCPGGSALLGDNEFKHSSPIVRFALNKHYSRSNLLFAGISINQGSTTLVPVLCVEYPQQVRLQKIKHD